MYSYRLFPIQTFVQDYFVHGKKEKKKKQQQQQQRDTQVTRVQQIVLRLRSDLLAFFASQPPSVLNERRRCDLEKPRAFFHCLISNNSYVPDIAFRI